MPAGGFAFFLNIFPVVRGDRGTDSRIIFVTAGLDSDLGFRVAAPLFTVALRSGAHDVSGRQTHAETYVTSQDRHVAHHVTAMQHSRLMCLSLFFSCAGEPLCFRLIMQYHTPFMPMTGQHKTHTKTKPKFDIMKGEKNRPRQPYVALK